MTVDYSLRQNHWIWWSYLKMLQVTDFWESVYIWIIRIWWIILVNTSAAAVVPSAESKTHTGNNRDWQILLNFSFSPQRILITNCYEKDGIFLQFDSYLGRNWSDHFTINVFLDRDDSLNFWSRPNPESEFGPYPPWLYATWN